MAVDVDGYVSICCHAKLRRGYFGLAYADRCIECGGEYPVGSAMKSIEQVDDERQIYAEHRRYKAALEKIKNTYGHVCAEYEICDHVACRSSHGAWEEADKALNPKLYEGEK